MPYASRAGEKLDHALKTFHVDVTGFTAADFGSSTGGFVDCLLQHGAQKVYAIETGYGVLDWKLRNDPRVIVMERTNAMHVTLPEQMDVITIDTSWTKLEKVVPNALRNLKPEGKLIVLVKPHYEADPHQLQKGVLPESEIPLVLDHVQNQLQQLGIHILATTESPIRGSKGGNKEYLFLIALNKKPTA